MAQTMINFRIDESLKKEMEKICREMGMSMTTAFTIFATKVARERRIPFEITAEPFYSESNMKYLEKVGMAQYINARPDQLSGGQKQRVAIARALAIRPQILLFDEPTAALDPEITAQIVSIIRELAETNITQVIVTHEVEVARKTASRVVYMENGYIVEQGDASCFANPQTDAFKNYLSH